MDTYNPYQEFRHLPLILKNAVDQKHVLLERLSILNEITYEKGSHKTDYLIRDKIKSIKDELVKFQTTIELFDNGKSGDLKAYEEILMFFVNNFINKFSISERLSLLNDQIAQDKTKDELFTYKYAGRNIIRKKNLYVLDLQEKLKGMEIHLKYGLKPILRKFLNDVNHILFFEKVRLCIEISPAKGNDSENGNIMRYLKNCIITFIWFNHKINRRDCTDINLKEFILNTFRDIEFAKTRSVQTKSEGPISEIIKKILDELDRLLQCKGEAQGVRSRIPHSDNSVDKNNKAGQQKRLKLIKQLKSLLNELCTVHTHEVTIAHAKDQITQDRTDQVKETEQIKGELYLFHMPGRFDFSLKTVSYHMINTLAFIYSWMLKELYRQNLPNELIDYLITNLGHSEDFIQDFKTAINAALDKTSQKKSFLMGETQHYIPIDLAKRITNNMDTIYNLLADALIESYLKIQVTPFKRNAVMLKKMIIFNDYLNSVWEMIQHGLEPLETAAPPH